MNGTLVADADSVADASTNSADSALGADSSDSLVVDSIRRLFNPESIAVVGASDQHGTPGHQIVANLVASGFSGPIMPISLHTTEICGLMAVPSILQAPYPVDLAVIVVPGPAVEDVVAQCGAVGVRSLVIISAGFAELGEEGRALQRRVQAIAHAGGMRIVGPNCLGIANTADDVSMDATFMSTPLPQGSVSVMTQSGAIGIAVVEGLAQRGLGVACFASVGNKADVSGNDLLEYWSQDSNTRQIVLYLESFGNPKRFAEIAPLVAAHKPILAIKAGRSSVAAAAASSHTAALALPDDAVAALLEQSGVLRVDDVEELLDLCTVLDTQPLLANNRIAIVTNAGGPGVLAADLCERLGVEVATFSPSTTDELRTIIGREIVGGPIDVRADAKAAVFGAIVETLAADPEVDAILVIVADVSGGGVAAHALSIDSVDVRRWGKPVVCTFVPTNRSAQLSRVAVLASPERAIRAFARLLQRRRWLEDRATAAANPEVGFDPGTISQLRAVIDRAMAQQPAGGWMDLVDAAHLIELSGIPIAPLKGAGTADEAVDAAERLGYPVVMKAANPTMLHKSDLGAVRVGLTTDFDVAAAFEAVRRLSGSQSCEVIVQKMMPAGVELLAGIVAHQQLGPVVVAGAGGRMTELEHDTAVRRPPISRRQAAAQLNGLRVSLLLHGFRGAPPADIEAAADALVGLSRLAKVVPEIAELDINPLIAYPHGVCAVDIKVRLASIV